LAEITVILGREKAVLPLYLAEITVILGRDYRYTWQNFIYKKGGREILMRLFMRNKESLMRKDEIGQALCFAPFALSYGASIHPKKSLIKKKIQ